MAMNTSVHGQSHIYGRITNLNGLPVPSATILLIKSVDSSVVKGVITDMAGTYSISKIPAGAYSISCSNTGYSSVYSKPFIIKGLNDSINLGTLSVSPKSNPLKEVTITTHKPFFEQKMDRIVINVAGSITSAGSTVLEILEKSPGIIIDQPNNIISMNGKEGVLIMVNGKVNRMPVNALIQMLSNMNSGNIERIELIATPPSNYDAEGNGGYINIIFRTNAQYGTNGTYSITVGYGKGFITEGSLNFNYRKNKLNLFGDISLTRIHSAQFYKFYHKVSYNGMATETFSDVDRSLLRSFYNGKIGLDYEPGKRTILGIMLSGYDNKVSIQSDNKSKINEDQHTDTILSISNKDVNDWYNFSANFNFQYIPHPNEKIIFNANYDYYKANNPDTYINTYYDPAGNFLFDKFVTSNKNTPIQVWVLALDHFKKLSSRLDLQSGIKSTISMFTNDVEINRLNQNIWEKDLQLSGVYDLSEKIIAVYSSLNISISKNINMKAGLRYEYTQSNLNTKERKNIINRKYGKLFPSFFISHAINESHSLSFSYSHRITRPAYNDMAPFLIFYDPYTQVAGNPALQPSITDAINTAYSFNRKIISLLFSYDADPITNFSPRVDSATNKEILSPANQKNRKTLSIGFSLPVTLYKWWNMQSNINCIWQQMNAFLAGNDIRIQQQYVSLTS
ncbi:MAG: TonB-dependent receptor domain-containing protein, partial [Flavisolibacter sp.]